jgi:cytochrome P450
MAALSGEPQIPEHIPPGLAYDFYLFGDERLKADPYGRAQEVLREAPPVFWSTRGNCWFVTRYDALVDAFKDTDTFSNVLFPQTPDDYVYSPYPLQTDPPRHKKYADPLKAVFSARRVAQMEATMRELALELIEGVAAQGECDFIPAIAEPYPILIFLGILGVERARFGEFRRVAVEYLNEPDRNVRFGKMQQADQLMSEYIKERGKRPRDDLISHLWSLDIDGEPISLVDMRRYGMMLFTAGLDSVTNGMGHITHHLATHRDLQQSLRQQPEDIGAAVEELLRRHAVTTPPRRVARDIEFFGAPLKEGDFVQLYVTAGNFTDSVFPEPAEIRLQRDSTHLTFGYGIHRCIGAHLARVEMQTFYQEWLKRIPPFSPGPGGAVYDPGHILRVASLALRWDRR